MKNRLLYLVCILGIFCQETVLGALTKPINLSGMVVAAKKGNLSKSVAKQSNSKKKSAKKSPKKSNRKKKKKGNNRKKIVQTRPTIKDPAVLNAQMKMIALNKASTRAKDSIRKINALQVNDNSEGYFASFFSNQKKAASFQTLNGTAAVFKSISGWQDHKFYILTNELPVGTIVRITTTDLKSICAKVINVLPEVGNAIQYRLNDAAAAILGVTNKTFQVSVTY